MSLHITIPGMQTTVQDRGRFGAQASGFTTSGMADPVSGRDANILVGNLGNEAVLEMTMMGLTGTFDAPCVIALTGADMDARLNGETVGRYRALTVKAGDTLSVGYAKNGLRGYLAVHGGFATEPVMGSRSTSMKIALGGNDGRALKKDDVIPTVPQSGILPGMARRRLPVPEFLQSVTLHAVPGPQDGMFTEAGLRTFFNSAYTVSDQMDRMGIRLEGEALESKNGCDIITDGIVTGSVQVTSAGLPILLMADRQTTGGYAKIATVISSDLHLAAQLRPGAKILFRQITAEKGGFLARLDWIRHKEQCYRINGKMPKRG